MAKVPSEFRKILAVLKIQNSLVARLFRGEAFSPLGRKIPASDPSNFVQGKRGGLQQPSEK
jgi:hypothetical protein